MVIIGRGVHGDRVPVAIRLLVGGQDVVPGQGDRILARGGIVAGTGHGKAAYHGDFGLLHVGDVVANDPELVGGGTRAVDGHVGGALVHRKPPAEAVALGSLGQVVHGAREREARGAGPQRRVATRQPEHHAGNDLVFPNAEAGTYLQSNGTAHVDGLLGLVLGRDGLRRGDALLVRGYGPGVLPVKLVREGTLGGRQQGRLGQGVDAVAGGVALPVVEDVGNLVGERRGAAAAHAGVEVVILDRLVPGLLAHDRGDRREEHGHDDVRPLRAAGVADLVPVVHDGHGVHHGLVAFGRVRVVVHTVRERRGALVLVARMARKLPLELHAPKEAARRLAEDAGLSLDGPAGARGAAGLGAKRGAAVVEVAIAVLEVLKVRGPLEHREQLRRSVVLGRRLEAHLHAVVVHVGQAQADPASVLRRVVDTDALVYDALLTGGVAPELAVRPLGREVRDVHPVVVVILAEVLVAVDARDGEEALLVLAGARHGAHAHVADPDLLLALCVTVRVHLVRGEADAAESVEAHPSGETERVDVSAHENVVVLGGTLVEAVQACGAQGEGRQGRTVSAALVRVLAGGLGDVRSVLAEGLADVVGDDEIVLGCVIVHVAVAEVGILRV